MKTCFTLVRALFVLALVVAFVNLEPTYAQGGEVCGEAPNPACTECENDICYLVACDNGEWCMWCEDIDEPMGPNCRLALN